jgi:hypothetical protein
MMAASRPLMCSAWRAPAARAEVCREGYARDGRWPV